MPELIVAEQVSKPKHDLSQIRPVRNFSAQAGGGITVQEMVAAYNSVEVKALDATLNVILGLYNKHKATTEEKIVTGSTLNAALGQLGAKTAVPLKDLDYLAFDGKMITLVFKKPIKESVPGTMGAAYIELSAVTKWDIRSDEGEIVVISKAEGTAKVGIASLLKKIAAKYGIVPMEIHNAALTVCEGEKGKSLYGVVFSDEKKREDASFELKTDRYQEYSKEVVAMLMEHRGENEGDAERQERMHSEIEKLREKYGIQKVPYSNYYYEDFNGIDLSSMALGTVNSGIGMKNLYGWLNQKMTEKTLGEVFQSNPDKFIPITTGLGEPQGVIIRELNVGGGGGGYSAVSLYAGPYAKVQDSAYQAYAGTIRKLLAEGSIEEKAEENRNQKSYFYRLKR